MVVGGIVPVVVFAIAIVFVMLMLISISTFVFPFNTFFETQDLTVDTYLLFLYPTKSV